MFAATTDLAMLEAEYTASLGSGASSVTPPTFVDTAPPSAETVISVWQHATTSSVAHGSLRSLVESPLMHATPSRPVRGPKIGLSIFAPEDDTDALRSGTIVSSPVLENKKSTPALPAFTQWEPSM